MKLYVPDPQKWVTYFERLSNKHYSNQSGAGIRPRVIPIEDSKASRERKQVSISAVLPAEQTTARAEAELKRDGIKPADVVDAFQSTSSHRKRKVSKSSKKAKAIKKTKKDIFGN